MGYSNKEADYTREELAYANAKLSKVTRGGREVPGYEVVLGTGENELIVSSLWQ